MVNGRWLELFSGKIFLSCASVTMTIESMTDSRICEQRRKWDCVTFGRLSPSVGGGKAKLKAGLESRTLKRLPGRGALCLL